MDGKTRSYRDTRETALQAGIFLKERPVASRDRKKLLRVSGAKSKEELSPEKGRQ